MLRIVDAALADKLRRILREEETLQGNLELNFPGACTWGVLKVLELLGFSLTNFLLYNRAEHGRSGLLVVEGQEFPVSVLDLPTMVESYKTYDDVNLVKTGDIGQVGPSCLFPQNSQQHAPWCPCCSKCMCQLLAGCLALASHPDVPVTPACRCCWWGLQWSLGQ